jgi:hypothetical protein
MSVDGYVYHNEVSLHTSSAGSPTIPKLQASYPRMLLKYQTGKRGWRCRSIGSSNLFVAIQCVRCLHPTETQILRAELLIAFSHESGCLRTEPFLMIDKPTGSHCCQSHLFWLFTNFNIFSNLTTSQFQTQSKKCQRRNFSNRLSWARFNFSTVWSWHL